MNLIKCLAIGAVTVAAFSAPLLQAREWKTVTIALEGAYAPWNLTNPDGSLAGFEPELARRLCAHMKVECKLVASSWEGMIPALNAGKFDVIMDALSITGERRKVIDFTRPYARTYAAFAVPKDSPLVNAPGSGTVIMLDPGATNVEEIKGMQKILAGKTIAIQASAAYSKFIYDNFGNIAKIREYRNGGERDLDLESGRIDVVFEDAVYLLSAIDKAKGAFVLTGPGVGGKIFGDGEALGIRKSDPELRDLFNDAIEAALADGTIRTLSLKWLKTDVTP